MFLVTVYGASAMSAAALANGIFCRRKASTMKTPMLSPAVQAQNPDYRVADPPATVHNRLLQKSSGSFALAVWNEQAGGTSSVTVDLGGRRAWVEICDLAVGAAPTQFLRRVKSPTLTLSDHPPILVMPGTHKAPVIRTLRTARYRHTAAGQPRNF